jgi:tellurite resistance protein TehA-like permease
MSPDDESTSTMEIEERLQQVGRYSTLVRAGFGVILAAFGLALVAILPSNLDSAASAVDAILMPLIFVGMGLLLFGIGMHLHLMHLNLVRQLRMSPDDSSPADDERDS